MKVLWFTNTPSLYDQGKHHYNGGGWIDSLERLLSIHEGIELAVSFFHRDTGKKTSENGTTYYPLKRKRARSNPIKAVLNNWQGVLEKESFMDTFLEVINDYQPDIIQVFGTEREFSQVQEFTTIPVVIHIQGFLNPCLNSYFPSGQSSLNFLFNHKWFFRNIIGYSPAFFVKKFNRQAKREKEFLMKARFVMGRTKWDKLITDLYNPSIKYFHVDEVLRPEFYSADHPSTTSKSKKIRIISTLSATVYKGIDVVLKTASKLKELGSIEFEWLIIGINSNDILFRHFERTERINHGDTNIICVGRKNSEELIDIMKTADIFVHPSYIDNSPNSVCEAQMLGLPVIACDVGGVSSIVKRGETGILVPSNGIFEICTTILEFSQNPEKFHIIGKKAKESATIRHDKRRILTALIKTYQQIINK